MIDNDFKTKKGGTIYNFSQKTYATFKKSWHKQALTGASNHGN